MKPITTSKFHVPTHHSERNGYLRRTLFATCFFGFVLVIVSNAGEPQESKSKDNLNEEQNVERAQDSSTKKNSNQTIFDGEWKLHSISNQQGILETPLSQVKGWLKNGKINIHDETIEFSVVESSKTTATISVEARDGSTPLATVERMGNVLRITADNEPEPATPTEPAVPTEPADFAVEVEVERTPSVVILEFWQVDPERRKIVEALRRLQEQSVTLRKESQKFDFEALASDIKNLTDDLKRIDQSPAITSLMMKSIQAREAGDHTEADDLDQKIQLFVKPVKTLRVLRTIAPMNIGDLVNSSNTDWVSMNNDAIPADAVTDTENFLGGYSTVTRSAGDFILQSHVSQNKPQFNSIPPGYRVVTIPLDSTTSHSGLLRPGCRIDIILTYDDRDPETGTKEIRTKPILDYIQVFAVDGKSGTNGSNATRYISLLLTPQQAVELQTAKTKGQISTVLRSSGDRRESAYSDESTADLATPKLSPDEKLNEALTSIVSLHFHDMPLADILRKIATGHGINIAVDTRSLETKGNEVDRLVSIDVDNISLRSALSLLMAQAGGLEFCIEDEVLKIGSDFPTEVVANKKSLEEIQTTLQTAFNDQETKTARLGREYRASFAIQAEKQPDKSSSEVRELVTRSVELERAVEQAFELQSRLQNINLQLAELELAEIRAKQERRKELSDQIIKRRIEQLKKEDELSWKSTVSPPHVITEDAPQ